MRYLILLVTLMLALLGCGAGSVSESNTTTDSGGSTATGGQGGATTSSSAGGAEPCVEPTPPGWVGPFQPYTAVPAENGLFTVIPDEAGGLAGIGPRIGPFACPHDFAQVGIAYQTEMVFGLEFSRPAAVKLDLVFGDVDGNPESAPVFAEATCYTDGSEPACGPLEIEGDYPMTLVAITPVHVEPGDVLYPTVQVDTKIGVRASNSVTPNPGWYYAPPGSVAGGPDGLWAALDKPPPGVQAYPYPPVIRLYETE